MSQLPIIEPDDDLLPVLYDASNEMLDPLVGYITQKGKASSALEGTARFKEHHPNHELYWKEIASEIQTFGGNTLANTVRGGKGVPYREVVEDVAGRLKVNFSKSMDVAAIEDQILLVVLQQAYEKLLPEQQGHLLGTLGIDYSGGLPAALPLIAVQALIRAGGFASYRVAVIVANFVARAVLGRGLAFVSGSVLTRAIGVFAGPVGWTLSGAWLLADVASPAYRVTMPCVLQVAAIRREQAARTTTKA